MNQNKSFLRNVLLKSIFGLMILHWANVGFSQDENAKPVSKKITNTVLAPYQTKEKPKRKILNLESAKITTKLNPLTYLAAGLMYTYQNVLSEQISANCTYEISCSEMTKKSIEKHGLIKGTLIGLHQLTNCSPNSKKDHCEHVISEDYKIINRIE